MPKHEITDNPEMVKALAHLEVMQDYLEGAKADLAEAQEDVDRLIGEAFRGMLEADGKEHGSRTIHCGPYVVQASIARTVSWDQDTLKVAVNRMSDADRAVLDVKVSIPEKNMPAIESMPEEIRDLVYKARSVKYGQPKFTVKEDK